jgi:hypothetical protein
MTVPADLVGKMSLAEKIGQLTMVTAGWTVTGPTVAGDVTEALRAGKIGSLFNLFGAEPTRKAQKIAVEETRLGIPLFFGFDVIHGFRTIFPIPLAEAGAFDPELWEETARHAANESAEAGLDLTFAPMSTFRAIRAGAALPKVPVGSWSRALRRQGGLSGRPAVRHRRNRKAFRRLRCMHRRP